MKTLTGRAIIHYPYKNPFTGITHNSIILSLEGLRGKYGIPGGQFDPRFDKNTLETAIRELNEELGLTGIKESAELIYVFEGNYSAAGSAGGEITIYYPAVIGSWIKQSAPNLTESNQ